MMGFRFDREYGPGTRRRFTFDFDEFLSHMLILVVLVFIVVAVWRMGLFHAG